MRKKLLFVLIALLGAGSMFAYEETTVATVGDIEYSDLKTALEASSAENYAILRKNVDDFTQYTLPSWSHQYLDMNEYNITFSDGSYFYFWCCAELTITGKGTITTSGHFLFCLYGLYWCILNVGEEVTCVSQAGTVVGIYDIDGASNGVVVNYDGTAISGGVQQAIYINGNVKATTGDVPVINVGPNAVLDGTGSDAAIYAAGYGIWNIKGTVKGKTGIYAKSGVINIDGATILGTGPYADVSAWGSGYNPTGDAIVLDSHSSYAGDMELNITGSATTVESTNAYAIREYITNAESTNAMGVSIKGGTYTGAANKGAIYYSDDLKQALKDGSTKGGKWVVNGIESGTYSSDPLVCKDNFYIKNNGSTYSVEEFKGNPEVTNKSYITTDVSVESLTINEDAAVIVKNPATLTVEGTVTVGDNTSSISYIMVEPGATLVAGSIATQNKDGLIVKSDLTNGTGVVKYDNVSTVESPKGSVQLAVSARNLDTSHNLWQHMGIPTTGTPTITKNVQTSYVEWNPASGWEFDGGSSRLTAPFVAHGVTVNSDTVGCVITYSGNLVTNNDAKFSLPELGYNFIANSYTAPISAKVLVNSYDDLLSSKATDGAIWVYTPLTRSYVQYNKASFLLGDDVDLPSMQGFFLQNKTEDEQKFTLNYNAAVITKSTSDIKDAAAVAGGKITLSDGAETAKLLIIESDDYSDSFEAGYDAEQMETGNIQIYALSGEYKLASIATNSIDGKIIEIKTKANTAYTLTFSNLQNGGFSLTDISGEQEKEVEIEEGGSYSFTAPANTTVQYFRLGEGTLAAEEADASELNFWVNENTLFVAGAESDIVIYNAAGVKVAAAKADGAAIQTINIAGLANGLYIVESGALTGKFIK